MRPNKEEKRESKEEPVRKKKFAQKAVNKFFDDCRENGNSFLQEQLKKAKTESEKKRIRKLLKNFS